MDPDPRDLPKSKSQQKREHLEFHTLAERLARLNDEQLSRVGLDESIRDAVLSARALRRGAYRRQIRYVSRQLSRIDVDAVRRRLDVVLEADAAAGPRLRHLERLREQLMGDGAGGDAVLEGLLDRYSRAPADWQRLRQLVRGARMELDGGSPGRHHRSLLRHLRELMRGADAAEP